MSENTYRFITLGCKVNSYESEAMAETLEQSGYREATATEIPSVVVINTCTVTSVSDSKSRQMIRRSIHQYPDAVICAVGCYTQTAPDILKTIPELHIVLGTNHRRDLPQLIEQYRASKTPIVKVENSYTFHKFEPLKVTSYHDTTRAYLKIQDGCNNWCSYCIIPQSRGPMRSRPKDDVIEEGKTLVRQGFKEIVLTGIHTAGYGLDFKDYSFVDLLHDLLYQVDGLKRIRISSIEASEISSELIQLLATNPKVVNHLHIPLQSGSDSVLKRMNRHYTLDQYRNTIDAIRKAVPGIAITTDVIVGFPGESEEEFLETKAFIETIRFAALHVFPFSPRKGTRASMMEGPIEGSVKKQRVHTLINLSDYLAKEYAKTYEGKIVSVLFETYDEQEKTLTGHATNYLKVVVPGDSSSLHQIHNVRIITADFPHNYGIITP